MDLAWIADLIAPPLLIVTLVFLVATISADPLRYRAEAEFESARARSTERDKEHRHRRRRRSNRR